MAKTNRRNKTGARAEGFRKDVRPPRDYDRDNEDSSSDTYFLTDADIDRLVFNA